MRLLDGLTNVFNQLVNRRSAMAQNKITRAEITQDDLRHIYLTGIGSKIVRLKAGYALDGSLQFGTDQQEEMYNKKLAKHVKKAAKFMVGFGRGCVVLHAKGDNLRQPLTDRDDLIVQVFSGDMVTVGDVARDLSSPRYMKPLSYNIRGHVIHHSRVVDFTYVEPSEFDLPIYRYGGVSEFELIYPQLINDAVVERACASMLERSSNWVYKVKGLKDAMAAKQDSAMVQYFSRIEDMRGIYGATLIDADDSVEVLSQALANLAETDQISLRRLAMVTGLSITRLVGESAKGLNATGDNEDKMDQDMIETLQSDYLLEPIQQLCKIFDIEVEFKENQGGTPESRMNFETKAITNAKALWEMGEDHAAYLEQYDIKKVDDFAELWKEEQDDQI